MGKAQFDTLVFSRRLYERQKQNLGFKARSQAQTRRWQNVLRARLKTLLGGLAGKKIPLNPRVTLRRSFKEYTRETVVFQSRPGLAMAGYLLLPRGLRGPAPCVICLPGHGRGADSIVGLDDKDRMRPFGKWDEYQNDFALQCVAHGFAAFAVEQLGFGCRRDPAAVAQGKGGSSCQPAAGAALLFGQTMAGWRVWDVMRTVDYLETRTEIAPGRIGVMGISGGGTVALYSAALDARLKAAVLSCSFNTFRDSIMSISHCIDNYVPGILGEAEMHDIAGLIAPRALFVEAGSKDPIFPVSGVRLAYGKTRKIYERLGAKDRMGLEIFKGGHEIHGKKAFDFLKTVL